jgi:hypothetical protein
MRNEYSAEDVNSSVEELESAFRTFQSGIRRHVQHRVPIGIRKQRERVQLKWRFALWRTALGQTPVFANEPFIRDSASNEEEAIE